MTDARANSLVTALANGESAAFADLYDRLGASLLRFARRMLRSTADAEDAVQDLFVELARNRHRLADVRDLDAYLFTMLRYSIGRRSKQKHIGKLHLRHLQPATAVDPADSVADDLELATHSLPPAQREVVALKIDGELTFAQIADVLEISPNTAASRYRYALEKLRALLETKR